MLSGWNKRSFLSPTEKNNRWVWWSFVREVCQQNYNVTKVERSLSTQTRGIILSIWDMPCADISRVVVTLTYLGNLKTCHPMSSVGWHAWTHWEVSWTVVQHWEPLQRYPHQMDSHSWSERYGRGLVVSNQMIEEGRLFGRTDPW